MSLVIMCLGIFGGIIFGSIPGLTSALALILVIPFTYTLEPVVGMCLLIGIYVGAISGGLIAAVLLNIPGTPSSIATCWDGYPMAVKQGQPGKAISIGLFSSLIGGLISAGLLLLIAPQLARLALTFGPWELFALGMMGLLVVVSLTGKDKIKGFISAFLGLLLAMVGMDPVSGIARMTFGHWQLSAGFESLSLMMGLLALGEILSQTFLLGTKFEKYGTKGLSFIPPFKELKGTWKTMIVSGFLGTYVGILPGIGGNVASLLAYNQARQSSKHPEKFGTGIPEGIVASEAANNAVNGGAMIPMMTLGIPGDLNTAIMMGGLMIMGLQPGPLLFRTQESLMGAIMIGYLLANIFMYLIEFGFMRFFIKALEVPKRLLLPTIIICCVIGCYAVNNRTFNVGVLIVTGILAYFMSQLQIPTAPMILGFILGPVCEKNFRTALIMSEGNVAQIFNRPVAVVLLLLGVFFAFWPAISAVIKRKRAEKKAAAQNA